MKNKILLSILAVALLITMTSCGGNDTPTGGSGKWTLIKSPFGADDFVRGIAYGNGTWVAGCGNGKMAYSSDGINWTLRKDKKVETTALAFGGGMFLAGAGDGKISTSTDGINWETFKLEFDGIEISGMIEEIIWDGESFVAITGFGTLLYTVPGSVDDWRKTIITPFADYSLMNGIAYSKDKDTYVVVGIKDIPGSGFYGRIVYSDDGGSTWTEVSSHPFGKNDSIDAVAFGGGKFVAGDRKLAYSTDGKVWTDITKNNPLSGSGINKIIYGNGKFVAVGVGGNAITSTDGVNWSLMTDNIFSQSGYNKGNPISVGYGNGKFIAGGIDGELAYLIDK